MAVKNHALDGKITQAAKEEFLKYGFQKASLHQIAQRAGITTGALYTRYKNKDALFCSLVEEAFSAIRVQYGPIQARYLQTKEQGTAEALLEAIRMEEKVTLDLLFQYHDACVLFFCRSAGSSLEEKLQGVMRRKTEQTVEFLRSMARHPINYDGIELIMTEQFHLYRGFLERGYSKERALACMETVEIYLDAGWKAILERIL